MPRICAARVRLPFVWLKACWMADNSLWRSEVTAFAVFSDGCSRVSRIAGGRCSGSTMFEPERRVELRKEHTVPILFGVGNVFLNLGGIVGLGFYGFFRGLKQFLGFKKDVERKIWGSGKIVEIRVSKDPVKKPL